MPQNLLLFSLEQTGISPVAGVLIILGITIALFIWEKIAIDITALIAMVLLMLSGILTPNEAISGFSNDAVITILFLLLLSAGLEKTGAVNLVGSWMASRIGRKKNRAFLYILIICGGISAFLNNTAVVAIFMPVIFKIARITRQSPTKLLMPLSFAAIAGGTVTLIGTSTNLVVNGIMENSGIPGLEHGFGMFEFSLTGLILFAVFGLYMYFFGIRMLPARRSAHSLAETYALKDYLTEIRVDEDSPLAGKRISDTPLIADLELDVVEIKDHKGTLWIPDEYETLDPNDILLVRGSAEDIVKLKEMKGISLVQDGLDDRALKSEDTALVEVVVATNASVARSTFKEINFRELFDAVPLAVRRKGEFLSGRFQDTELRFGDNILLEIRKDSMEQLQRSGDFLFTQEIERQEYDKRKIGISLGILAFVILGSATGVFPILEGALIGAILMFLFKIITIREAYREVDWRIIFVLAALIPLGTALEKTGTAAMIAGYLKNGFAQYGPLAVLLGLYAATTLFTSIMSNGATAALLSPVAISLATQMQVDPRAFLLTVLFAASTCYLTPLGYQTNIMIYGPGNFKFTDFVRIGGILSLLCMITVSLCLYWIYF